MNINALSLKKSIKQFQQKISNYFRQRKNTLSFFGSNQYVDWNILLILLTLSTLTASVCVTLFFFKVNQGEDAFSINAEKTEEELINTDTITRIIGVYDAKETAFTSIINSTEGYPDPSR